MRTLVMADVHGSYRGLIQALERANYDPASDLLIQTGDVADGWPDTKDCVDFLLKHNTKCLRGNHDEWVREWMSGHYFMEFNMWFDQGGQSTIDSYNCVVGAGEELPQTHIDFFENQLWYYVDDQNRCFVHAGWDWHFNDGPENYFMDDGEPKRNVLDLVWTRSFWDRAKTLQLTKSFTKNKFTKFDEVFVGHNVVGKKPVKYCEVWNLDTGAGYDGVVTVMDVDTHEYWQSDNSPTLYPETKGR